MIAVELPQSTITSLGCTKKNKCPCCNKKLGLVSFTCRCGENFCAEHRYNDAHNCNYDFQEEQKRKLSADLVKVVGDKLNRL
jgi:hypothetical protein